MYNSQNLPLEKRKIIKKSLNAIVGSLFLSLFASGMLFFVLYSINQGINQGYANFFWALLAFFVTNLLFAGSAIFYQYLYYKFYYYNFEIESAEIKKGVIANATGHVRYARIQNIYVDQDILDRIFGLYDVHYETAGERSGFYSHVDGLSKENADKLVAFLNERVGRVENVQNESENYSAKDKQTPVMESDQEFYARENMPIEKKLIFSMTLTSSVITTFILFFVSARIIVALSELAEISPVFVMVIAFIAYSLFSVLGFYIYAKIWYKNFYFKFDAKGGVIMTKVIAVKNAYIYYDRIQNINISQGIVERFLGINTLRIETAAEGSSTAVSMMINGLSKNNAEALKEFLLKKSEKYRKL